MISTVTTKGQVTIPVEIRSRFHINPSDRVDFIIDGDKIMIIPIKTLKQLRGSVTAISNGNITSERQLAKRVLSRKVAEEMA